jgi:hypothetical protein
VSAGNSELGVILEEIEDVLALENRQRRDRTA